MYVSSFYHNNHGVKCLKRKLGQWILATFIRMPISGYNSAFVLEWERVLFPISTVSESGPSPWLHPLGFYCQLLSWLQQCCHSWWKEGRARGPDINLPPAANGLNFTWWWVGTAQGSRLQGLVSRSHFPRYYVLTFLLWFVNTSQFGY